MVENNLDFSYLTIAVEKEHLLWKNGTLKEGKPAAKPMLDKYWKNVRGKTYTQAQYSSVTWQDDNPWSSAYVSWMMNIGLGDTTFPKSAAHREYVKSALYNRNNNVGRWKLFSLLRETVKVQVGDVVAGGREGSYTNSHGDIVWKISGGKAYLAGGNLSDTNGIWGSIKINSDGSYPYFPKSQYYVVLKKF